jgi:hypothetical protein
MPLARLVRRFAPLLFAAACAAPAFAQSDTYTGQLMPTDGGTPIPIVVEMRERGTLLTGTVKTSDPLPGSAAIESGRNVGSDCSFSVPMKPAGTLRLAGTCGPAGFTGKFSLRGQQGRVVSSGSFNLVRKTSEAAKGAGARSTADSAKTTACTTANTRCLAACPRGDTDAEFLCANRCRTKLQACKGQAGKQAAAIE